MLFHLGTAWRLSLVTGQYNFSTVDDYLDWSKADCLGAPTFGSRVSSGLTWPQPPWRHRGWYARGSCRVILAPALSSRLPSSHSRDDLSPSSPRNVACSPSCRPHIKQQTCLNPHRFSLWNSLLPLERFPVLTRSRRIWKDKYNPENRKNGKK